MKNLRQFFTLCLLTLGMAGGFGGRAAWAQNNLTMDAPGYNASGKFGQSLNGGTGLTPSSLFPATDTLTLECWGKTSNAGSIEVVLGKANVFWIGHMADGLATGRYNQSEVAINSSIFVADGAWHHFALALSPVGGKFFVDGALAGSSSVPWSGIPANGYGVRQFAGIPGFAWSGDVDEVALWSVAKYTTAFTPRTTAYTGNESGLTALWHLNGNGNDSFGVQVAGMTTDGISANATTSTTITPQLSNIAGGTGPYSTVFSYSNATNGTYTQIGSAVAGTNPVASAAASGLSPSTTYYFRAVTTDSTAGTALTTTTPSATTGTPLATTAAAAPSGVTIAANNAAWLDSPYNWNVDGTRAKTINAGAYRRIFIRDTTSCAVNLTIGAGTPYSQIYARLDGVNWQKYTPTASGAQAWNLTLPTPGQATTYLLEIVVKSTTETADRWNTQAVAVSINSLTLDTGASVSAPASRKYRVLVFGDSITEAVRSQGFGGIANDTDRNDAINGYAYNLGVLLDAEVGVVGFGATGLSVGGSGGVPALPGSYNFLWSGQGRSFSVVPDLVIYNEGANEGANVTTQLATVVSGIGYAATTQAGLAGTRHLVLRPFGGQNAANLQTAVVAVGNANVVYGDTTGFWGGGASDGLHPYGYAFLGEITPKVAALALPLLHPATVVGGGTTTVFGTKRKVQ